MNLLVITAPEHFVSLDEAKAHLRLEVGSPGVDDGLITAYLAAACAHIDGPAGWLGRAIGVQTLEYRRDAFCETIPLPFPPLIDVVSVKYLDVDGIEQTVTSTDYAVTGPATLRTAYDVSWPSPRTYADAVRIRYRAGYVADPLADPLVAAVPAPIKAAVLLMVGDLYENRETVAEGAPAPVEMSMTVERLLSPYRVWSA
jgi:uncharacterized phiE125 gp8 family phage protein